MLIEQENAENAPQRHATPHAPSSSSTAAALRAVLKRCSTLVAAATLSVCGRVVWAGPVVGLRFN